VFGFDGLDLEVALGVGSDDFAEEGFDGGGAKGDQEPDGVFSALLTALGLVAALASSMPVAISFVTRLVGIMEAITGKVFQLFQVFYHAFLFLVEVENPLLLYNGIMAEGFQANRLVPISKRGDWWWPDYDQLALVGILRESGVRGGMGDIDKMMVFVKDRRVVVHAGANCGIWTKRYAGLFDKVWAFEPDLLNFVCLNLNVREPNVRVFNQALGAWPGRGVMQEETPDNCGALYVGTGAGRGVEIVTVDDLGLTVCDLLQLDVEGYELLALRGAVKVLRELRPTVVAETLRGHAGRYGYDPETIYRFLSDLGYVRVEKIGADEVFQYGG